VIPPTSPLKKGRFFPFEVKVKVFFFSDFPPLIMAFPERCLPPYEKLPCEIEGVFFPFLVPASPLPRCAVSLN